LLTTQKSLNNGNINKRKKKQAFLPNLAEKQLTLVQLKDKLHY